MVLLFLCKQTTIPAGHCSLGSVRSINPNTSSSVQGVYYHQLDAQLRQTPSPFPSVKSQDGAFVRFPDNLRRHGDAIVLRSDISSYHQQLGSGCCQLSISFGSGGTWTEEGGEAWPAQAKSSPACRYQRVQECTATGPAGDGKERK